MLSQGQGQGQGQSRQGASGARSQSVGSRSGPQGGRAFGEGPSGTPEPVTFEPEKLKSRKPHPGLPVSVLTVDGEAQTGEATIKKSGEVVETIRELSKQVEKEPLPPEYREQAEHFHSLVMEGDEGTAEK